MQPGVTIVPQFREATRMQAKASIMIEGLSGKGKSGLALMLAYGLADQDWGAVYAVDTENRSLDLFRGITAHIGLPFGAFKKLDILPSHGYAPTNYLAAYASAIASGAKVVIGDSISHMWQQSGGVLDLVSKVQAQNTKLNKWTAWGDPVIVAQKNAIYECIRNSEVHVITTVRVKEKFDLVEENGKKEMKSLGEQQLAMPDIKFEPDLVLSMVKAGRMNGQPPVAKVVKSRYAIFTEGEEYAFTADLIKQLRDYLAEGVDPAVLLEQQRLAYVTEITNLLNSDPSAATMWPIMKDRAGHKETPIGEMDLNTLRQLFSQLVS